MRSAAIIAVAAALTLGSAACGTQSTSKEHPTMADAREQALEAGKALVARKYPDFSPARKTPVVVDQGETWQFTYELPSDMLGGAPVVVLNKADLSVRESYRTQ